MIQMKINFADKFNELSSLNNILRKVECNNKIKVFYGLSNDGKKRLVFLSTITPAAIKSTKMISVSHYKDNENLNWLSFDLEDNSFSNLFYTFCSDMISSLEDFNDEKEELEYLMRRFHNWKKMFQNLPTKKLSEEREQGLFGELYFLYKYMLPRYGIEKSILSWAGPLKFNKDFSIDDTWYEIKTASVNANSIKITSTSQLDSNQDGFLSVVKVEKMSPEYNGQLSSILDLIQVILEKIYDIQLQDEFLNKVIEYGVCPENSFGERRYDAKNIVMYNVSKDFPRLTENSIGFIEIENISYSINLSGINRFKVEEL